MGRDTRRIRRNLSSVRDWSFSTRFRAKKAQRYYVLVAADSLCEMQYIGNPRFLEAKGVSKESPGIGVRKPYAESEASSETSRQSIGKHQKLQTVTLRSIEAEQTLLQDYGEKLVL